jgi:hypothetical protein
MPNPLADQLQELAINKDHWKELKFNENFLAETLGRGISEYIYAGCAGTYGASQVSDDQHAS